MSTATAGLSLDSLERLHGEELAKISHALRTPLTSIIGFTSAILNDPTMERETWTEFLRIVKSEGERLSKFVEELLYVSFSDNDGPPTPSEPATLESLLQTVLRIVSIRMNQPPSRFELHLSGVGPALPLDRQFMIKMLSNILGNAARFSSTQSPIRISATMENHRLFLRVLSLRRGTNLALRTETRAASSDTEAVGLARTKYLLGLREGTLEVHHLDGGETSIDVVIPLENGNE